MKFLVEIKLNSGETEHKQLSADSKKQAKDTVKGLLGNNGKVVNVVKMS